VNTQPSLCHYAVPLIRSRHTALYKCVLIDWLIYLKDDLQRFAIHIITQFPTSGRHTCLATLQAWIVSTSFVTTSVLLSRLR